MSGCLRWLYVGSGTIFARYDFGNVIVFVAGMSFSFRTALSLDSSKTFLYTVYSACPRICFCSAAFLPVKSNAQTSISATSCGSSTRIATASPRWFVRCRPIQGQADIVESRLRFWRGIGHAQKNRDPGKKQMAAADV